MRASRTEYIEMHLQGQTAQTAQTAVSLFVVILAEIVTG